MIERVEFDFADATRKLAGGGERAGGERRDNRDLHQVHVAKLRDNVAAAIDHDGEVGLGFFQKIREHAVEHSDVLDGQNRNRVHTIMFSSRGITFSAGMAMAKGVARGTSFCLLNLCNKICETAFNTAKTFRPVLEMASKLCSRFFPLLRTYSM